LLATCTDKIQEAYEQDDFKSNYKSIESLQFYDAEEKSISREDQNSALYESFHGSEKKDRSLRVSQEKGDQIEPRGLNMKRKAFSSE